MDVVWIMKNESEYFENVLYVLIEHVVLDGSVKLANRICVPRLPRSSVVIRPNSITRNDILKRFRCAR